LPLQFALDGKHSVLFHKFKANDYLPIRAIVFATVQNYPRFIYFHIPDEDAIGWEHIAILYIKTNYSFL